MPLLVRLSYPLDFGTKETDTIPLASRQSSPPTPPRPRPPPPPAPAPLPRSRLWAGPEALPFAPHVAAPCWQAQSMRSVI